MDTQIRSHLLLKTLLLVIVILFAHQSFAQGNTAINNNRPVNKNTFKGFAFAFPYFGLAYDLSLGYEREITKHSSLEWGTYYFVYHDEMGLKYHRIGFMPAYRYYTISEKNYSITFG